jgi:ABC-2 type transport system permease protein
MIGALYLKELRLNRTQFAIWAAIIVGLIAMTMAAMPSMLKSSTSVASFIAAFPPEFLKAFNFDASSFGSPLGFAVVYNMIYTMLLGSIFSITIAARTLHREQAERTAEFLLVRPIGRTAVFLVKSLAWLTLLAAMNAVLFAAGAASLAAFTPPGFTWSLRDYGVVSAYAALIMFALGGVGLLLSALAGRARSLTGPAIGIVLALYLLDIVAKMTEDYGAIGWASPFKWLDTGVTRAGYGLEWWRAALFLGLFAVTAVAALLAWRRKDILA